MSRTLKVAAAVGGLAAVAGLAWFLHRRRGELGMVASQPRGPLVEKHKSGDMTVSVYEDGHMPIGMRVGIIQDLVRESVAEGDVRDLAHAIVGTGQRTVRVGKYQIPVRGAGCSAGDQQCKADAIGRWTAENIRYTGDVAPVKKGRHGKTEPVDYFSSPRRTVELGGEDCDGHSTLNNALMLEVDIPSSHRVTAPSGSSDWGHIYAVAQAGGRELAIDTTLPGYRTGREASHSRRADFPAVRP